ncbi:MAG: alpha/beta hydrolase [Proteobacteria bacterium]|nr:alpha/beta hydrolase [Pseudomonadota bacterium]
MPILARGGLKIDFSDDGSGETVVLIHSSVSGNRQWKRLIQELKDRFRVLAPNLYGYGETTPWQEDGTQTLADHVTLIETICDSIHGPIRLVGHSFGGAVALKVAANLGERVSHLALYEPNPFYLLDLDGRAEAFSEAMALHDDVKALGKKGDWMALAERFAEYFSGDGSWVQMPAERQVAFAKLLLPNYYEWDCVQSDVTTVGVFAKLRAKTLLISGANTRLALREIADLFRATCPHWTFVTIPEAGHMAPLTHPDLVNPIVKHFLG